MLRHTMVAVLLVFALAPQTARPEDPVASVSDWFRTGSLLLDSRYRIEHVELDSLEEDALASTLRLQAGFETGSWNGISALVEAEFVESLGSERFNSTTNARTDYPVVADPDTSEINQAYLYYSQDRTHIIAGRQVLPVDNSRFLGTVDFRQNQQTYDAVMIMHRGATGLTTVYGYMDRVRRFLSDDHPLGDVDMNAHMLDLSLERVNGDTLTVYAHALDMQEPALSARSHRNIGIRYQGSLEPRSMTWLYHLEYADQAAHSDGADSVDADYYRIEAGPKFSNQWVLSVGVESLGGDGTYAFQTPFATGHSFNGRADVFAGGTPPTGLVDTYASLALPLGGTRVAVAYHNFESDTGNLSYGDEWDLTVSRRFGKQWQIAFEVASYRADTFSADTTKASFSVRYEL